MQNNRLGTSYQAILWEDFLTERLVRLAFVVCCQFINDFLEVLGFTEVAINRGETDIGDVVKIAQAFHHELANLL